VPAPVTVRRSRAGDFDGWYELFEAVAAEGRWIGREAIDREQGRQSFDRALDSDHAATFLVEADGRPLGMLGITLAGGVAELGMMVRDGHRGQGIGAALMDACLVWCREHGAHKVTLMVWPHNAPAIRLYERCGFTVEGRLVRHFRRRSGELWDAVLMALVLDTESPGSPLPDTEP
jgi:RimJ/RimL family protein N-acetyltransferase